MSDEFDSSLRDKINELVERLPASFVYSLLSEIEGMDEEPVERVQLVRQYVIEYLNRQRTNRARRLFTSLFEAFLIDDDALYHAGVGLPGMIQRIDVGALWELLSRDAFPLLAVEAQEKLDEQARHEVIDRALRSPAAKALRERMRVAAVKHLDALLTNRKTLDETLAGLSRYRPRRTRLLSAFLDKAPPVESATLLTMRDILANADGVTKLVAERLYVFPPHCASDWELDRMTDMLLDATGELAERFKGQEELALLLPLSVLNVKRNYALVALFIRQSAVDPGRGNAVTLGLTAHFLGTVRALSAALTAILKLNDRVPGSAIRPSGKEKLRVEALMQRLGELIQAVGNSGLMEDRRSEPAFRNAWGTAARIVATRVGAVAMERAGQAAAARRQAVFDHNDVLWLLRLVWVWQEYARDFGFETYDLVKWRDTLLEEMRANVEKAMKFGDDETLDERMEHLLRINAISGVFGARVSRWIPTTSQNMTKLIGHRIETEAVQTEAERAIIDDLVATVRKEVGKSRYWKSDELMGLIELSDKARGSEE